MFIIGILKIMEVQEDDMEVQEEAVLHEIRQYKFNKKKNSLYYHIFEKINDNLYYV